MSRKRLAPARWVLPTVVNPPDSVCFQIQVPNDKQHIAAFLGAIYDLAKPYNWGNDNAHTAIAVGKVWFAIFEALRRNSCEVPPSGGSGGDDMPRLRQSPTNPCLLEQECLPDQWVTLLDISKCLSGSPGQPGPGGGGPGPGENVDNCYKLSANGQLLLPVPVAENYVITVHSMDGGWTDGGGNWYCPNGQSYTLGICSGTGGFTGGDPLPSALHMSLIAKINGIYYPTDGPINVPTGTPSSDVIFLANDASPSDNFGEISFCVKVANQTEAGFDHLFDFTASNGGWTARPRSEGPGCGAAGANYIGGTGWTEFSCPSINAIFINVGQDISPRNLSSIAITFTGDDLATNNADVEIYINQSGTETLVAHDINVATSPHTITATGSFPGVTGIRFRIAALNSAAHLTMVSGEIVGTGTDPF